VTWSQIDVGGDVAPESEAPAEPESDDHYNI
jgi:hypothetical protein